MQERRFKSGLEGWVGLHWQKKEFQQRYQLEHPQEWAMWAVGGTIKWRNDCEDTQREDLGAKRRIGNFTLGVMEGSRAKA